MRNALRRALPALSEQLLLAFDSLRTTFTDDKRALISLRRVAVGSQSIDYRLQRVRRRTIGLQINAHGLSVRAPHSATLREIEAVIFAHGQWIRTKQIEWRHWHEKQRAHAPRLVDQGTVRYLGRAVRLRILATAGESETIFDDAANEIRLALSNEQQSDAAIEVHVARALQRWLQAQAQDLFAQRLAHFADRIDARFAGWRLSSARTQWGSCSHDGRIRLSWRLMHFPVPVIDYVIAHELAHLRELNHSPRFWREVARLLPGYEVARDQIKRVEISQISF
ncbi:MAG: M48 family metallopeptidase [Burkholderiaceae bacterium]|nr:M48 family metallopeptidase [Burkholderiaceae bacterium]